MEHENHASRLMQEGVLSKANKMRSDVAVAEARREHAKAQRDLERIKIEAEQKIASAKAEAESLRLQKENVTPQLLQLRRIEASIKAIEKWDGHLPTQMVPGAAVPFIDLTKSK